MLLTQSFPREENAVQKRADLVFAAVPLDEVEALRLRWHSLAKRLALLHPTN
jgi:hypothetical protein